MTTEQEKAIYRLNLHKDTQVQDDCCIVNAKDIEIVLSMLEEKDKQIDKLKKHNDNLLIKIRNRVKQVKKLEKYSLYKEEFSRLNKQLQNKDKQIERYINILATNDMLHIKESQEKDKIIDLMSKEIESLHSSLIGEFGTWETEYSKQGEEVTIEEIKQYFENKAKEK